MVVSVDYTKAIDELASQLKDALVTSAILKAQLDAVTKELNNVLQNNENLAEDSVEEVSEYEIAEG